MSAREKERRLPVSGYSRIPFMHVGKRGMLCNNKSSSRWCLCISVSVCLCVCVSVSVKERNAIILILINWDPVMFAHRMNKHVDQDGFADVDKETKELTNAFLC